jgi:hypothetical protein
MRTRRNLLAVMALIIFCGIAVWLSAPIQGGEKKYEVKPYVDVSQYHNPQPRAIDAYERLMERYMDLTEINFVTTGRDIESISQTITSIDNRLTQISERLTRIENHLGIPQPKPQKQLQDQGELK